MTQDQAAFSLQEAMAVQHQLRASLGLPPETFPLPAFIGMISDEIEMFRKSGRTDEEISAIIERATGRAIPPAAIALHYAPPAQRRRQ